MKDVCGYLTDCISLILTYGRRHWLIRDFTHFSQVTNWFWSSKYFFPLENPSNPDT